MLGELARDRGGEGDERQRRKGDATGAGVQEVVASGAIAAGSPVICGAAGTVVAAATPTSGQQVGYGTLFHEPLPDPRDETVEKSYQRWLTGTRQPGGSMPP